MTEAIAVEGSAVGALATWANGLDGWVRMVTAEVLSRRTTLDEEMIAAAYQQLLAEKGLTDDAPASVPTIEISAAPPDDAPSLRLIRIGDTSRINRLVDGQEPVVHMEHPQVGDQRCCCGGVHPQSPST